MKRANLPLGQLWLHEWSLSAFLGVLIVMLFVLAPLARIGLVGGLLLDVTLSLFLISGVIATASSRILLRLGVPAAAATIGVQVLRILRPGVELAWIISSCNLVLIGLLTTLALKQVFSAGAITVHRIQGAVAVYLLLGLIWSFLYDLVEHLNPGSFQGLARQEGKPTLLPQLIYFSYVTLTTVGYGDITPVHPMARSLANLESLTGQLFPAILIARLVSLELYHRRSK